MLSDIFFFSDTSEVPFFYETNPTTKKTNHAVLFSSGFALATDVRILKRQFNVFDIDFHAFSRNDKLIAKTPKAVEKAVKKFSQFIQEINEKGYEHLTLFGKSFGCYLQLLAMSELTEETRTQIKIVGVPALVNFETLIKEGKVILPDGETQIDIHQTNKDYLLQNQVQEVRHDTLLIIGENDGVQNLDELKEFEKRNKDYVNLEVIPNCNHFNILENMGTLHQIMKFLDIKPETKL